MTVVGARGQGTQCLSIQSPSTCTTWRASSQAGRTGRGDQSLDVAPLKARAFRPMSYRTEWEGGHSGYRPSSLGSIAPRNLIRGIRAHFPTDLPKKLPMCVAGGRAYLG